MIAARRTLPALRGLRQSGSVADKAAGWSGGFDLAREGGAGLPAVGERVALAGAVSPAHVRGFADLSGDDNPLHLDADFAAQTAFGAPIAHGMLVSSLFSTIFGVGLPGSVYLKQELKFEAPVFVGDAIEASVEVVRVRADRRFVTCRTEVVAGKGTDKERRAVSGEALVLVPSASGE